MIKLNYSLILLFILSDFVFSQSLTTQLDSIVVSASRNPQELSTVNRTIDIINSSDLTSSPSDNLQDVLQYHAGVDLKQRGTNEVQSDISIRGGSFEHTLIMIDGIKISDSQTGHHNLNLPIIDSDIERIEILKGQGSRIFGPNAFNGVVNFITKTQRLNGFDFNVVGGQNNYYKYSAGLNYNFSIFTNRASVSKSKSDGYIHNTAFDILKFSNKLTANFGKSNLNFFIGTVRKKFGANSFYTPVFPNQLEETHTKFINLIGNTSIGDFDFNAKVSWRENKDDYILDYERVSFYRNLHETDSYSYEIQATYSGKMGKTTLGLELLSDQIQSTNLGNWKRENTGIFFEQKLEPIRNLNIVAGVYAFDYSNIGWKYNPGFDIGYLINPVRIFFSYGEAFRVPTFTELYYTSPTLNGNPILENEETKNLEFGISHFSKYFSGRGSVFYYQGKNLIDYVRTNPTDAWEARNIAALNTTGVDLSVTVNFARLLNSDLIKKIDMNYVYVNLNKNIGLLNSRYLLDHLSSHLVVGFDGQFPAEIGYKFILRSEERINTETQILADISLSKSFEKFTLSLKATNLFNSTYEDIIGVKLPGRWISAGIKYSVGL